MAPSLAWNARQHLAGAALAAAVVLAALVAVFSPASAGTFSAVSAAGSAAAPAGANLTPALARQAQATPEKSVEVIVQLRAGFGSAKGHRLVAAHGGRVTRDARIINAMGATMSAGEAAKLASDPAIRAVTVNGKVAGRSLKTVYNQTINTNKIWSDNASGAGVGVAVIDTGIQGNLPDFRESRADGTSRVKPASVLTPDPTTAKDLHGHGTHVAGLIAGDGKNRPEGDPLAQDFYRGSAPDADLISVKVSDDQGATSVLDVITGIQYVYDNKDKYNIRVANLSLSSTVAQSYLIDPLDAAVEVLWGAGVVVVAAAGNDGDAADAVSYAPGNDPYVLTVGASDDRGNANPDDDTLAPWSSRGRTQDGFSKPDVLAPGSRLVSNSSAGSRYEQECPECIVDTQYMRLGGTSMAAAVASGVAADLISKHPNWTPNQIKGAIKNTARDVPGAGKVINAQEASAQGDLSLKLVSNVGLVPSTLITDALGPVTLERVSWRDVDFTAVNWSRVSWRRVSWRSVDGEGVAGTGVRCDCPDPTTDPETVVDPARVSWRRVSWRTSFTK